MELIVDIDSMELEALRDFAKELMTMAKVDEKLIQCLQNIIDLLVEKTRRVNNVPL